MNRIYNFRMKPAEIEMMGQHARGLPDRTVSRFIREAIWEKIERERQADKVKANAK